MTGRKCALIIKHAPNSCVRLLTGHYGNCSLLYDIYIAINCLINYCCITNNVLFLKYFHSYSTYHYTHITHDFIMSSRFHIIGLLVLFLQDVGDIFLELSKTLNYFKIQDGKEKWIPEMCANISFAIFTIQQ